ncbi:unnamed protein product [Cuscuta campestris]|uniref:ADF-H domain-containing protein n=2 Tax=Cuscuta sect. Cleistogrammica TaxID=1824901 RepID=A0A484KEI8_9ASTE|nr:hypothetical protein DM860_015785 [Cuscuta australis]VFQ63790.1 unnamed protein product [Cuscuta campestris]
MANAASGIDVHDDCKLKFLELKAKRTYRYIVFKIGDPTIEKVLEPTKSKIEVEEVVVEKVGEPAKSNAEEKVVEKATEPTKRKIEKDKVIVEKLGEPAASYAEFTASLPDDECRYAVYDFDFVTAESCQKSKIFFIAWSPDTARVRNKMIYASTKDRFKRELDGIQVELQATDPTEMDLDVLKSRAN